MAEISAGGRTDGDRHDEANSRFSHFCESAQKKKAGNNDTRKEYTKMKGRRKDGMKRGHSERRRKRRKGRRQDREAHSSSCGITQGTYKIPTFSTGTYMPCNYVYFK
jgi:hypothetical protein